MTHREIAEMRRNLGLDSFFAVPDNHTIVISNLAFETEVNTLSGKHVITLDKASRTGIDNTGFSAEKVAEKLLLADEASMYSGFASVRWDKEHLNKPTLMAQCHAHESDFLGITDTECYTRAQATHDLLSNNIGDLGGIVTAINLTHLQGTIDTFHADSGTTDATNQASPADTKAFKTALRNENKSVPSILLMVRVFKATNLDFYNRVVALCEVPAVEIIHNDVIVEVLKTENNEPVTDSHMTLSNTKKTDDADIHGMLEIDEVRNGKAIMTITQKDRLDVVQEINIQAKHVNHFVVHMTLKPLI